MTATRTVLIADDDLDTRIVFGTYLRHFGLRVLEASSGAEAHSLLERERPDVVLFDPMLEDLLGGELEMPRAVAVSASILAPNVKALLRAHRIPVLHKPCSPVRILEVVLAIVERGQAGIPSPSSTSADTSISEEAAPNAS